MALLHNKIKKHFTKTLRQLVKDFSRDVAQVVLYMPELKVDCPNCMHNSLDKSSSNIYNSSFVTSIIIFQDTVAERTISPVSFGRARCPVCYGKGSLAAPVTHTIQAHAIYNPNSPTEDGDFSDSPAGRTPLNHVVLKTSATNYRMLYESTAIQVNGIYMEPLRPPIIRGLSGEETLCIGWFSTVEGKAINTRY